MGRDQHILLAQFTAEEHK